MKRIAKFEKVSLTQFIKDWQEEFSQTTQKECEQIYQHLLLPCRATKGSAGYDFFTPIDITLSPRQTIKIPTGIRVRINDGWVLKCYPRSGLGFKYRLQLNNTVGIIDSDYYFSDNEGHIFAKITNDSNENKTVVITKQTSFMQGIFVEYGITVDDSVETIRNGGFGSTTISNS
ncbi:MAG: deoxyuridine 5'-triphosphate nucleotidohydrolase [Firmicutes bacterium]|nr:deoxyuridine 5'-triphosphate nucleotidohydrolase [Bacillota bacterium]